MTKYRRNCLIIAICCFAIAGLAAVELVSGESRIGAVASFSDDLGYESGYGVRASHLHRGGWWGAEAEGSAMNRKKRGADHGYTYSAAAHFRLYPADRLYMSAGYGLYGYRSEFAGGTVWKKSATSPVAGCGYDGDRLDIDLRYWPEESDTPNRVESAHLACRYEFAPHWELMGEIGVTRYDQAGERETGRSVVIGIGYKY